MSLVRLIRRHLSGKLFLSYLVVILVGCVVVVSAIEFALPAAFERHMAAMAAVMGADAAQLEQDLFAGFGGAVTEALALALLAALVAALVLSLIISRRVVLPVQEMMVASERIAAGRYEERVGLAGSNQGEHADELGRLAQSFNLMASSLQQTEVRRSELIGDVAHELRTPLATIKGYMEGLLDGVLPADAETFHLVYREASRLQRLAEDLQELSRVEAGAFKLALEPTPVSRLVETVTQRLQRQFEDKGVALTADLAPDLPPVRVDEGRLGQVLLNLVGNALQYTPAGGWVRIGARRQGQAVRLSVADSGIGLSPEQVPHIFERFYRVDRSRSRAGGGSGIGLTIAKHLVEAQEGRIWAESPGPDQGSTFHVTLPGA